MKLPLDPGFPSVRDDAALLPLIENVPARPVFIMGLHRSGTTFLYDSIARCFPLANLSLYHLFYYGRLLRNHQDGGEPQDRDTLRRLFQQLGITDRKIDAVHVDDDTVEEYGWILRNHSYSMQITAGNRALFDELCRKLRYVTPGARAVLLKNPCDVGNARKILEWFPNARFIYIARDPLYILNSQINAVLSLLRGKQPFLTLLLDNIKTARGRSGLHLVYGVWKLARGIRSVTGDRPFALLLRRAKAHGIENQLNLYFRDLEELPAEAVHVLDYQSFNERPQEHLRQIADFLRLPLLIDPSTIKPKPRTVSMGPQLQDYAPQFWDRLRRKIPQLAAQRGRRP